MTATATPGTKLVEIEMFESSDVDHPANRPQVEGGGWIVMKANGIPIGRVVRRTEPAGPTAEELRKAIDDEKAAHAATAKERDAAKAAAAKAAATTDARIGTADAVLAVVHGEARAVMIATPGLSEAAAVDRVCSARPDLVDAYRRAQQADAADSSLEPVMKSGDRLSPLIDPGGLLVDIAHRIAKASGVTFEVALDVALSTEDGQRLDAIRRARFRSPAHV